MIVIEGINHIGITVSKLERSIAFYKELFDFDSVDKYCLPGVTVMKMADIVIALYEVEGYKPNSESKNKISFYVDEEDFEDALDELEENGIEIAHGPENIRGGKSVTFLDPDGNQIELSYPQLV
jgi:metallothiol transferase